MTAKEMFEELGYYDITDIETTIKYSKNEFGIQKIIMFDISKKSYIKVSEQYFGLLINLKESKAIQQQIKELGWEE